MINKVKRFRPAQCAMAVLVACAGMSAQAFEFDTEGGWKGNLSTTLSAGASWRAQAPDSKLFSAGDGNYIGVAGGTGGSNTSNGNLNWDKGDRFSTPLKAVVDFSMSKNEMGVFARAKAWYDQALNDESVRAGNGDTGFAADKPLSDASQPRLNKFDGIELLDAYVYNTFYLGAGQTPLQIRAGKQVVNWGESLFIQGLNQLSPIDVPALRKPGTEVKEALLPVWSLYGNLGLGNGMSVEGFYQLKWEPHNIDQCGLYWSPVEWGLSTSTGSSGCKQIVTTLGAGGNVATVAAGGFIPLGAGKEGKDSGQWGLAFRMPVDVIDSEIGLYVNRINSRTPIVSAKAGTWGAFAGLTPAARATVLGAAAAGYMSPLGGFGAVPALIAAGVVAPKGFWEYPDKIDIYGASLATNISGWSVSAELSHTPNLPVQVNGNDLLASIVFGVGPMGTAAQAAVAAGSGTVLSGYDRMDKTQLQANTIKILPSMMGATQGLLIAEAGMQWLDMPNNSRRYGRAFIFGNGSDPTYAGLTGNPAGNTCGAVNEQTDGCKNDGYVNDFSWGYRIKVSLDYPNAFGSGYTLTPSIFFGHDVDGYSADTQFIEGRKVVTLGLKADYQKKFQVEVGYTTFGNSAKYDPFRDRDYYSASVSYSF